MSKKFSVSSTPTAATPAYDAGDPSVKAKGYQMTETSEGVELHEPDRKYSFRKVSTESAKSFLHPPDRLIVGRVIFKAKYLGYLMVKDPKGVPVVKAAVEKIKVASEVQRINNKDFKDPEVDLCISIRALTTVDKATKDVIVQHSLPLVSFSADVKRTKQEIFSYIAKTSPKAKEYICYAYEVPRSQGRQISATVSQAFELAFRRYQDAKDIRKQYLELKQKLETASPEEKEKIQKEITSLQAKKIAEEDRLQRARDQIKSEADARVKSGPEKAPATGQAKAQTTATTAAAAPKPPPLQEKKVEPPPPQPEPTPPPPQPEPAPPPPQPEPTPPPPQPEPTPPPPQPEPTPPPAQSTDEPNGNSNGEMEPEPEPIQAEVQPAPAPPPVWKRGFDVALNTLEQQIKDLEEAFEWRKEMERKQRSLLGKDVSDQYLAGIEDKIAQMPGN